MHRVLSCPDHGAAGTPTLQLPLLPPPNDPRGIAEGATGHTNNEAFRGPDNFIAG